MIGFVIVDDFDQTV